MSVWFLQKILDRGRFIAILGLIVSTAILISCQTVKAPESQSLKVTDADPLGAEYLIGPEDVLEINVWKNPDLSKTVVVRPDGMITLSLIGDIRAGGATGRKVQQAIRTLLKEYYKQIPEVTVTVAQVNSYPVYILGEVRQPGQYQLKRYTRVLQAVAMAGGFTEWAKKNKMILLRSNPEKSSHRIQISYDEIVEKSGPDPFLHRGDTLIVP